MARQPLRALALSLLVTLAPAGWTAAEPSPLAELLTAHGIQPVAPPSAAPDFSLPLQGGGEGDLSASHGDWVVLTFFATWCGPCRSEMPSLERLHRGRGEDGPAVLAVSVDRRREVLDPFLDELDLTLPVYWDQRGDVGRAYRATSIPVSYLIDPSGLIVGMARGARDWSSAEPLFDALRAARPTTEPPHNYAALDTLQLPEVLDPPTAIWSLSTDRPRPGRPFTLEVELSWSGRIEDYLPQPPRIPLPEGVTRGRVAASSSSLDRSHLVRYQIELLAEEPGVYELDPVELRYLPAMGDGPLAARIEGPVVEVASAGPGRPSATALALFGAALVALAVWLLRRRRGAPRAGATQPALAERLRGELDRAKSARLAGDAGAGFEALVDVARELEAADQRRDLERRLESVRFGGLRPDGAELEAIERRLERALAERQRDPDDERRRRLRLRRKPDSRSPLTSKETS